MTSFILVLWLASGTVVQDDRSYSQAECEAIVSDIGAVELANGHVYAVTSAQCVAAQDS